MNTPLQPPAIAAFVPMPVARMTFAPMPAGVDPPTASAERLLLVDDNPRNLQMLLQFLGGRGYSLLVAKNGETALEIAKKTQPAIVLLDVMMPGIDGFETCRRLKADPHTRDAAVLFLSAATETDQKLAGFAAGGVDYIPKPIKGEEVVARVNTHLTIRRLNRQLQAKVAEIEHELSVVQEMQRRLLPPMLPQIESLELAAHYITSRYAGGDYYDVVQIGDGRWGILVADVSGHGTPAAVTMAMTRTAFRAHPEFFDRPDRVLEAINQHFEYLWEETGFVTALYGVYDPARRTLHFACAGHPRPMVYRANEHKAAEIACRAIVPLLIGPLPHVPICEVSLEPGDRVLFYTDGVVERSATDGEFFGTPRLASELISGAAETADRAIRRIVESVESFAGPREPADDQTLLLGVVR